MPMGNGKGPPWGNGPGTGRRRGRCDAGKDSVSGNTGNSENLIAIIGGSIALATSIVKLISSRKKKEKDGI